MIGLLRAIKNFYICEVYLKKNGNIIKYYKKKGVTIGKKCRFSGNPDFGTEPYLVSIGDNCLISCNVVFMTHDGALSVLRNLNVVDNVDKIKPIAIGNNVFIGMNSSILPGVSICDNVIVGFGSLVTKSIVDSGVYAGVPAKYICSLEDYYEKNKAELFHTWDMSAREKREFYVNKYRR
jgi:acetyltransferase-like isoleucine patch superfamily enzyme